MAFYCILSFSALESLKKEVSLQEEVLDTQNEIIRTHHAMSVVLKALGREEEAEWEMELAGERAKRLDSLKVPLEILQAGEEMRCLVSYVPISSRQTGICQKWLHTEKHNLRNFKRLHKGHFIRFH